jgi:hypothetical protein
MTARESYGAGIGAGHSSRGNSTVRALTVSGGNVTAIGINGGAGIGRGYHRQPTRRSSIH